MDGASIVDSRLKERKAIVEAALIQNRKPFLSFLQRRVRNLDFAEDIFQQFCLRALTYSSTLRNPERIVTWLYRILHSTLADFFRSKNARLCGESEYSKFHTEQRGTTENDPENICTCYIKLLPALKPEYSQVLGRIDLRGESRDAVARDLGITNNLVRVRLHRARQALKSVLLDFCQSCCHEQGFMDCHCIDGTEGNGTSLNHTNCNAVMPLTSYI